MTSPSPPAPPQREGATAGAVPAPEAYRYDAFISYRHVDPDRRWAKWAHAALETYRVPRQLVAQRGVPARVKRVFRDEEELPASSDLNNQIEQALAESRFLIVVCSPRTPRSRWVNREVERFRELGRHDRIVALLIEGEPRDAFPEALRAIRRTIVDEQGLARDQIEEVEPLAADVRASRHESSRHLARMAKLRLLACVLGCRFDDLRQREQERRTRRIARLGAAAAALLCVMAALAAFAFVQRRAAVANALAATASAKRATSALASSDFREGVSRLRRPETSAEGVAMLARAAREGDHAPAYARLWTLLQQRRFWVDVPASSPPASSSPTRPAAAGDDDGPATRPSASAPMQSEPPPPAFETVEVDGQRLAPTWFARSADGQTCVTVVNGDFDSNIHKFRVWRIDGEPILPWQEFPNVGLDVRELASAHLSADGRLVAVVGNVWRAPQALAIWDTKTAQRFEEIVTATGQAPNEQFASFTQVRFLPPPGGEVRATRTLLLTASSRGDATVYATWDDDPTLQPLGTSAHAAAVNVAAVDEAGQWLMSASTDRLLLMRDLADDRTLGQPIPLPRAAEHVERAGADRVRATLAGDDAAPVEFQLQPAVTVAPPAGAMPAIGADEDGAAVAGEFLSTVPLPMLGATLADSPEGSNRARLVRANEIEVEPVSANGGGGEPQALWRASFPAPVWRAAFADGGRVLLVQTELFTTDLFDAATGRRIGASLDESRLFGDDADDRRRPSRPLASTFVAGRPTNGGGVVLTRSFFWDAPNVAHYWFTAWDLASGLPLADRIHLADTGLTDDPLSRAALTPDGRLLLLGTSAKPDAPAVHCVELGPPPTVRASLPDLAEALAGLRVELDGSFSAIADRKRRVDAAVQR